MNIFLCNGRFKNQSIYYFFFFGLEQYFKYICMASLPFANFLPNNFQDRSLTLKWNINKNELWKRSLSNKTFNLREKVFLKILSYLCTFQQKKDIIYVKLLQTLFCLISNKKANISTFYWLSYVTIRHKVMGSFYLSHCPFPRRISSETRQ